MEKTMAKKTLSKEETVIVDNYFIQHNIQTFDVPNFNLALCNTLPTWRAEQLVNENKKSLAYIDYVKTLLRSQNLFFDKTSNKV